MGFYQLPINNRELGAWGERQAALYLENRGYRILGRRWHVWEGEIDIVAREVSTRCLVFIEVKTRRSQAYGAPVEAISSQKKERLAAAVARYLEQHGCRGEYRVDLLTVEVGVRVRIQHWQAVALE